MPTTKTFQLKSPISSQMEENKIVEQIGESIKVKTKTGDSIPTRMVVRNINTIKDLEHLKKQDPFLYYSIPAVRRASILGKDVDLQTVLCDITRDQKVTVMRNTCISFECDPMMLLDEEIWQLSR